MKMKCGGCGEKIASNSRFCNYCGVSTKEQRQRRTVILLVSIAAAISAIVILWKNYLMPWQIPLFNARRTIIKYVREVHPDSKIVKEHIKYEPNGYYFLFVIYPDCYITYEENGFQYVVYYGKRTKTIIDRYNEEKLTNDVRVFIDEEFFKPRGIENVNVRCQFHFNSPSELPTEWSEYDDSYTVNLTIRDQGSTPREVGWIYDFYRFWNENLIFPPEWYLAFHIRNADEDGSLYVSYKSNCIDATDLYRGFF